MNLVAALPLTGAEKKIAAAARALLIGIETQIASQFGTLKTPAAITSFWGSVRDYAARNYEVSTATTTASAPAQTKATSRTKGAAAKSPARKTRTAAG